VLVALIVPIAGPPFTNFSDNIRGVIPPYFSSFGFPDWAAFTGGWILLWPFYVAAYGLVAILVAFPAAFLLVLPVIAAGKTRYLAGLFFGIVWPMVGITVYTLWFAHLMFMVETYPTILSRVAVGGIASGLGFAVIFTGFLMMVMVSWTAAALLVYRLQRRRSQLYPEAAVTLQLLKILAQVTKHPSAWGTLEIKHELVGRLEIIAICLEHYLPRRLQSDSITDSWLQRMTGQMAAAQRALKPWVLMPKPDTREQFIARVADAFVHAASGEWDALPRSEDTPPPQRQHWHSKAIAMAKAITIALLPLLTLWGAQQLTLKIPEAMVGYATIVGLFWMVGWLAASLDASFHAKVSVMQDVAQSVPFLSKWLGTEKRSP
jgi:hypothetical protein